MNEELEKEIERHINHCLDFKFPTTDIKSIKADVEYTAGYFAQWMKEQMIDKACKWLETINLDYYQIREDVFSTDLVKDFRKAMEE